jgi:hypothetical protein
MRSHMTECADVGNRLLRRLVAGMFGAQGNSVGVLVCVYAVCDIVRLDTDRVPTPNPNRTRNLTPARFRPPIRTSSHPRERAYPTCFGSTQQAWKRFGPEAPCLGQPAPVVFSRPARPDTPRTPTPNLVRCQNSGTGPGPYISRCPPQCSEDAPQRTGRSEARQAYDYDQDYDYDRDYEYEPGCDQGSVCRHPCQCGAEGIACYSDGTALRPRAGTHCFSDRTC